MDPGGGGSDNPLFTSYVENKEGSNHKRNHQFFLVDSLGVKHHAATAEDHGDAHYSYHPSAEFTAKYGEMPGHCRKDLIVWLEMVINTSQREGGLVSEIKHIGPETTESPFGTFFVSFRQKREQLPDGRHRHSWFLKDQHTKEHLAVVGEEITARDGHYTYSAEEPFASQHPLGNATNQAQVLHWVESMLTHWAPPGEPPNIEALRQQAMAHTDVTPVGDADEPAVPSSGGWAAALDDEGEAAAAAAAAATPGPSTAPTPPPTGNHHGKKKGGGGGGHAKHGKHKLSGAAAAAAAAAVEAKRQRTPGPGPPPNPSRLTAATVARVSALAAADGARRSAARAGTLSWLRQTELGEEETSVVDMFLVTLKQLLDDAQTEPKHLTETKARKLDVPPHVADHRAEPPAPENGLLGDVRKVKTWSYKDVHTQAHAARLTLECLRELSALCLPPRAMLDTKLADVVLAFTGHPHPVVASAAQALVARWQRRLLSAANVLTDPTFCEDPTVTVEAGVKQIQRLEEVAAAADAAAAAAAAAADAVDAATGAAAVPASAGVGAAPAAAAAAAAAGEEGGAGEAEGDAGAGAEGDDAMAVD